MAIFPDHSITVKEKSDNFLIDSFSILLDLQNFIMQVKVNGRKLKSVQTYTIVTDRGSI